VLRHEMVSGALLSPSAANLTDAEFGTTHAQVAADMRFDLDPSLFIVLPIVCLVEEVIVIDGCPINLPPTAPATFRSRLDYVSVELYHLAQSEIDSGLDGVGRVDFAALNVLTKESMLNQATWQGELTRCGDNAACANLKQWAVKQRDVLQSKTAAVGGCFFAGDSPGIARLPSEESTKSNAEAHGVMGNVIRISLKDGETTSQLLQFCKEYGEPFPFCFGGVVLVGRRVQDPLWRDLNSLRSKVLEQQEENRKRRLTTIQKSQGLSVADVGSSALGFVMANARKQQAVSLGSAVEPV